MRFDDVFILAQDFNFNSPVVKFEISSPLWTFEYAVATQTRFTFLPLLPPFRRQGDCKVGVRWEIPGSRSRIYQVFMSRIVHELVGGRKRRHATFIPNLKLEKREGEWCFFVGMEYKTKLEWAKRTTVLELINYRWIDPNEVYEKIRKDK